MMKNGTFFPFFLRTVVYAVLAPVYIFWYGQVEAFRVFSPSPATNQVFPAEDIIRMADSLLMRRLFGKLIFRTRCLKRSLVLFRLLRENGHSPRVHLGIGKRGGAVLGHAWLSLEGKRIPDPEGEWEGDAASYEEMLEIGEEILPARGTVRPPKV